MSGATAAAKQEIAAAVVDTMLPNTLYLLGSGTTVRAIADELKFTKTLLGVDAVVDGGFDHEGRGYIRSGKIRNSKFEEGGESSRSRRPMPDF